MEFLETNDIYPGKGQRYCLCEEKDENGEYYLVFRPDNTDSDIIICTCHFDCDIPRAIISKLSSVAPDIKNPSLLYLYYQINSYVEFDSDNTDFWAALGMVLSAHASKLKTKEDLINFLGRGQTLCSLLGLITDEYVLRSIIQEIREINDINLL